MSNIELLINTYESLIHMINCDLEAGNYAGDKQEIRLMTKIECYRQFINELKKLKDETD